MIIWETVQTQGRIIPHMHLTGWDLKLFKYDSWWRGRDAKFSKSEILNTWSLFWRCSGKGNKISSLQQCNSKWEELWESSVYDTPEWPILSIKESNKSCSSDWSIIPNPIDAGKEMHHLLLNTIPPVCRKHDIAEPLMMEMPFQNPCSSVAELMVNALNLMKMFHV